MDLRATIAKSESLVQWLDRAIDGTPIKTDLRTRLAVGCLDIAFEHQKAIVLLAANRLFGTAVALIRLIFEAYVRGVWLHRCATDRDLDRFATGKLDRTFQEMINEIEKVPGFEVGVLSKSKQQGWNAMNDFTHAGIIHVSRRHTEASVEPNYEEPEIVEALEFANAIALMAAIEVSLLAQKEDLAKAVLERSHEFVGAAA